MFGWNLQDFLCLDGIKHEFLCLDGIKLEFFHLDGLNKSYCVWMEFTRFLVFERNLQEFLHVWMELNTSSCV